MRVLKRGNNKVYTYTCSKCNSDLEYTDADVFYTEEEEIGCATRTISHFFKPDERYHSIVMHKYSCIKCPVCGYITKRLDFSRGNPIETIRWQKENKL